MSASTYLVAIPLSVIAVSSWLVQVESGTFSQGNRTASIQQVPRHSYGRAPTNQLGEPEPTVRLDHDRYGWTGSQQEGGALLGTDTTSARPLGSRPGRTQDWLDRQIARLPGRLELPDIPGVVDLPSPSESFFETVPADSGFHIAANEATKMDMGKNTVTFNGQVKLASPQFHLTATKMIVHLGKDKKSFRLLEAAGDVDVQLTGVPDDKKYRGQSNVAIYDPGKGTLTLTGWPKIQGSGQELIAAEESTKVVLIPKTGKMDTVGRAQTRIAKRLMEEQSVAAP